MKRSAFTLIELLVVIAIIAILIGILLPALSQARQQGRRAVTLARLRDLGIGALSYSQDNEDQFPSLIDREEKAFYGLSLLARTHQLPPDLFINPNTTDRAASRITEDGRPVLADVGGDEIANDATIAPGSVNSVRWHCSFAYDNDPKKNHRTDQELKLNSALPQVFIGDRADYINGRTFSANWRGEGMCLLWTDGHGEFVKSNAVSEQADPNIYHHNEFEGEGGTEFNEGVAVSLGTRDTHLRFFTEEEDDELLPD